MQKRALNAKECRRIKKQFSDISIDSAIRQHYAEKKHKQGLEVRAFESQCLKDMIESFERNFNQPEHSAFFDEAMEQVAIWVKNKYTQNFGGALMQLQCIATKYPTCMDALQQWSTRQRMKHEYAVRWAEKNIFKEETED